MLIPVKEGNKMTSFEDSRAFTHLARRFGSQLEMARAIGVTGPAATHWSQSGFPMLRRMELLKVAIDRGLDVNPTIVLGRDMVAMIRQIAAASQRRERRVA
jgi:hypothetical protein